MAKPEFTPCTRLITTLGASGVGECAELVMPKDGEVSISVATERSQCVRFRKQVKAGTSIAITDGPQCGRIYSWVVNYDSEAE